jgi:hypothetical protein
MSIDMKKGRPGPDPRGSIGPVRPGMRDAARRRSRERAAAQPIRETRMRIADLALRSAALAAALAAGGCATPASRAADYEKALAPWQGASEEALVARWGPPQAQEQIGHGRWLTYVVRSTAPPAPTVAFSIGGFGFGGGRTAVGGGVGAAVPVGQPAAPTCTTRFLIEDGKVSSWTFEGAGCGALGGEG